MDYRTDRLIPTQGRARPRGVFAMMADLMAATTLVVGIAALRFDAQPAGNAAGGADSVEIGSYDVYFKPNLVTIPADTNVTVLLPNHGEVRHNFSITDHRNKGLPNLGIDVPLTPGETTKVTINAPAGDYYFYCNIPGHEAAGMFGYLQVKPNAPISTAEATDLKMRSDS